MCPPPRRTPERREPARALPVPFWRYILRVEPATSATCLGLMSALAQIGLVHHHHVVQQLLADPRSELLQIELVLSDLIPTAIKNGQTNHSAHIPRGVWIPA